MFRVRAESSKWASIPDFSGTEYAPTVVAAKRITVHLMDKTVSEQYITNRCKTAIQQLYGKGEDRPRMSTQTSE